MPPPLQSKPHEWRSVPVSLDAWGKALCAEARHFADRQLPGLGMQHEIYNEPDNRDFFLGTEADYLELYRHGAQAVRAADPDAPIVGPALAFTEGWIEPFLQFVGENRLPLDTFSFHYYPEVWSKNPPVAAVIASVSQHLDRHPERATTEMSLNEYNAYRIEYPKGGRQDRFPLAAQLLHNYAAFLSNPALTSVYWAQFMDTGGDNFSGMISYDGHRKAVFNAYSLYSRMPIDRRQVTIKGANGVEALASSDDHTAALLLWNLSGADQTLHTVLGHLPFKEGSLRVFRIDGDHASWGDNPAREALEVVETHPLKDAGALWSGMIPKDAVVYLEASDNTGKSSLAPHPLAHFIRTLHYYPDRSKSAYADFDRRTWTVRLGMARDEDAEATIGVLADALPKTLTVSTQVVGQLRRYDANSLLGLRLDYAINDKYVKSVLFHGRCGSQPGLYDKERTAPMPWGTKRAPDTVVVIPDLTQFIVTPQTYAPPGWTGRTQITATLQNAGPHTQAKIVLRRGQ